MVALVKQEELLMQDTKIIKPDQRFSDDERPFFMQGAFRAWVRENDEPWGIHFEKKNVIVNSARKIMAHLIGDCGGVYECINMFKLGGDNSLTSTELLAPQTPTPTDTDLVYTANEFTRLNTDTGTGGVDLFNVSYPNAPSETSVLFTIDIEKSEANILDPDPTVYVAAGLLSDVVGEGILLFASQTFPVMTKTPSRAFRFEWEIRF
jgi:hypothetical protein